MQGTDLIAQERLRQITVVEIHSAAKEKGWYDGINTENLHKLPPNFIPARLALVHFDLAGLLNIQIGSYILAKHNYNKTRPYRHGNKVV